MTAEKVKKSGDFDREEMIELLISDRNHHFQHPNDTNQKFIYSLSATLVAATASVFTAKVAKIVFFNNVMTETAIFLLLLVGFGFVFWGLAEHAIIHSKQRKRLEAAIAYLTDPSHCDYKIFWEKFGKLIITPKQTSASPPEPTPLFALEPDLRKGFDFHDSKINVGIILVIFAFAIFVIASVNFNV